MSWEGAAKWVVGINGKRMMFVHARLMKFDRVLLIGRYRRRHEKYDTKKRCNTRTSQEVTHPSTTLAQARLSCGVRWDPSSSHRPVSSTSRKIRHEKEVQHEDFPEVTHPSTTLAQARLAAEFDGIRCISLGMIAHCQVLRDQWLYGFDDTRLTCDA
ncbi:unnamed protein product [Sphenostylis stenocarpa]|uniref:Uncharacterized protein n=1 Tax=Sphenostylis stenocarpa TaxID=92480 RepID=A0AA86V5Y5_9FABA|nr:unnamed protein product [Sphenostylis stenocarpa]